MPDVALITTLCGREREIRQIADECEADRLVVLLHEPGLGATALIQRGLQPALVAAGCITLTWSDWQGRYFAAPLKEAIAEAVRQQADPLYFTETGSLCEMLERIHSQTGRRVALLLDRFEDYLRCHEGTDISDSFDAELSEAIAARSGRFVASLQRHALRSFERLSQYVPNLLGYQVQLSPLTPDAAREAVCAEVERRGMEMEPEVLEALTGCPAAAYEGGVHTFLLMQGVERILDAEARLKSTVARQATLTLHGGPDRLIMESLDARLGELNATPVELLFRWCTILISPERSRLSVTEKALTDYAGKLNRFVLTTLPLLLQLGLLRSVEMPEVTRYEIHRESLTPILHDWWLRREADLTARRRALFRVRSISVAAGSIVTMYVIWLWFGK